MIYNLCVKPIEIIIEAFVYSLKAITNSSGLSLIVLSIIISIILNSMKFNTGKVGKDDIKYWSDHIKNHNTGNMRYYLLQTYYRQMGYNPYSELYSLIPLLIQIMIMIAVYSVIKNSNIINGAFLVIDDLKEPDGLLFGLNIIPILMLVINLLSSLVYNKGKVDKKLFILNIIIFGLLYNSPSGLTLYWTTSSIVSLISNIVKTEKEEDVGKIDWSIVILNITMGLFIGLLIPVNTLYSDPFGLGNNFNNTFKILINAFIIGFGLCAIWLNIVYITLLRKHTKVFMFIAIMSVVNFVLFGHNFGTVDTALLFNTSPYKIINSELIYNCIALLIVIVITVIVSRYKNIEKALIFGLVVSCLCVPTYQLFGINNTLKSTDASKDTDIPEKIIKLTDSGKNVLIVMVDRGISGFLPLMMQDDPELKDVLDGFTYYPNTLSTGGFTVYGAPALYGGYEYTVESMNERSNELLKDKHTEALCLMPFIFAENGYESTFIDPTLSNYSHKSDLSEFRKYDNVHAYRLKGKYTAEFNEEYNLKVDGKLQTNGLVYYSIFRILPDIFKSSAYKWIEFKQTSTINNRDSVGELFIDSYSVLDRLDKLTEVVDSNDVKLNIVNTDTAHETAEIFVGDNSILPVSKYYKEDSITVDGRDIKLSKIEQKQHYYSNFATFEKLKEYFEFIKKQGVWDNTRIIIASDHGERLGCFEDMINDIDDMARYNSLLLVKDFNSTKFKVDNTFMVNADVPCLVMNGIISNPVNPFTHKKIEKSNDNEFIVSGSEDPAMYKDKYTFLDVGAPFYKFEGDNIFDMNAWKFIGGLN